jgi:hypothetical protein
LHQWKESQNKKKPLADKSAIYTNGKSRTNKQTTGRQKRNLHQREESHKQANHWQTKAQFTPMGRVAQNKQTIGIVGVVGIFDDEYFRNIIDARIRVRG